MVTCARRAVEGLPYEFHSCDVRDDDAVKAMIDAIVDRHGRLDVVVNNAGGSPYVLTAESSAKFNRKIIELNLIGALSVSQHANDKMQNQPARRVDRQHLQSQRPAAVTGHRRLRGGQGRPGKPDPDAGGGVGAEGAGERLRGRHGRNRTSPNCSTATPSRSPRFRRTCRSAGWPRPPMSVGPQRFWRRMRRPTSAVPRWRCTAAASRRTIWPPRTQRDQVEETMRMGS